MRSLDDLKNNFAKQVSDLSDWKNILGDTKGKDQITAAIIDDLTYTVSRCLIEDGVEPSILSAQDLTDHIKGYIAVYTREIDWANINDIESAIKHSVYKNKLSRDKKIPLDPLAESIMRASL